MNRFDYKIMLRAFAHSLGRLLSLEEKETFLFNMRKIIHNTNNYPDDILNDIHYILDCTYALSPFRSSLRKLAISHYKEFMPKYKY